MDYAQFLQDGSLIMVAVLYIIGMMLKGVSDETFNNKYIPFVLLVIGMLLSIWQGGVCIDAVMQGVIVTGMAVYSNQVIKQIKG